MAESFDSVYEQTLRTTINRIIDQSLIDGSLRIPDGFGTPIRAKLIDFRRLEGYQFDFFESNREIACYRQMIDPMLSQFVHDHKEVMFSSNRSGICQKIYISPAKTESDLREPVVKNIHEDEEIRVKMARSINNQIECDLVFEYVGQPNIVGSGYVLYLPTHFRFRKNYDPLIETRGNTSFDIDLQDRRLPIVLNMALVDSHDFFYSFFSDLIAAEIDPYTRQNLKNRLTQEDIKAKNPQELEEVIERCSKEARYEEDVLSSAIVQAWYWQLREIHGDEKVPGSTILMFQDARTKCSEASRALDYVLDNGVQNMIDLYSEPKIWDLDKFLKGELR